MSKQNENKNLFVRTDFKSYDKNIEDGEIINARCHHEYRDREYRDREYRDREYREYRDREYHNQKYYSPRRRSFSPRRRSRSPRRGDFLPRKEYYNNYKNNTYERRTRYDYEEQQNRLNNISKMHQQDSISIEGMAKIIDLFKGIIESKSHEKKRNRSRSSSRSRSNSNPRKKTYHSNISRRSRSCSRSRLGSRSRSRSSTKSPSKSRSRSHSPSVHKKIIHRSTNTITRTNNSDEYVVSPRYRGLNPKPELFIPLKKAHQYKNDNITNNSDKSNTEYSISNNTCSYTLDKSGNYYNEPKRYFN